MLKIKNIFKKDKRPNWPLRTEMSHCWATLNNKTATTAEWVKALNFLYENVEETLKEV